MALTLQIINANVSHYSWFINQELILETAWLPQFSLHLNISDHDQHLTMQNFSTYSIILRYIFKLYRNALEHLSTLARIFERYAFEMGCCFEIAIWLILATIASLSNRLVAVGILIDANTSRVFLQETPQATNGPLRFVISDRKFPTFRPSASTSHDSQS
jgi:hypothetical protein